MDVDGSTTTIPNGSYAVAGDGAVSAIETVSALELVLEGDALLFFAEPSGRVVGFHPTREMITNQIPLAWYSGLEARPQILNVPNVEPGEYTILLVASGNQSAWSMDIKLAGEDGIYDDVVSKSSMITWGTPTGITLRIRENDEGLVLDASDIWTLYEAPPGVVGMADELKREELQTGTAPTWVEAGE